MTNPETPPAPSDQSSRRDSGAQDQAKIAAELRGEDGQALSRGEVELAPEKKLAYFYPRDSTALDTLQNHAKTLFLIDSNQSFGIFAIHDCFEQVTPDLLHFHVELK